MKLSDCKDERLIGQQVRWKMVDIFDSEIYEDLYHFSGFVNSLDSQFYINSQVIQMISFEIFDK